MKKRIKIGLLSAITAIIITAVVVVNIVVLMVFDGLATAFFGTIGGARTADDGDNMFYTKDYGSASELYDAETMLGIQMAEEGVVLLKNDGVLPLGKGAEVSVFGTAGADIICGGSGSGAGTPELNTDFRTGLEAAGLTVNDMLWKFYTEGTGSGEGYGIGSGSIMFGASFDWSINEVPASVIASEAGLEDTFSETTAIYVISRTGGEDGDLARDMAAYGGKPGQNYLEPDETERGVLDYLSTRFDDIILILNANNTMSLDFVRDYPNIKAVIHAPGLGRMGAYGLANVISGYSGDTEISPSGHLVDTMVYDVFSSPAMQNMGDFRYGDTGYNYVSYSEGIYVGYRYYETRYEDAVMGAENLGDYDYDSTVAYPFGYGLSYTTFDWSDFSFGQPDSEGNMTVTVTVTNTGNRNGKEVVQLYFQSPYTEYDRENNVEKAAVALCGFAKTDTLAPGESETVSVTINKESFKSYDYIGEKTYILDAGFYYVTAASNAHSAANNILAAKGYSVDGNTAFVGVYEQTEFDATSYANDTTTGNDIENRFDDAALSDVTYLTRQNWAMMDDNGLRYGSVSSYASPMEIDGMAFTHEASTELLAELESMDSLNPNLQTYSDLPAVDEAAGIGIIDMRGLDYDDPIWDTFLNQLALDELRRIVYVNGYSTLQSLKSVNKPTCNENDGPAGFNDSLNHRSISTDGEYVTMAWATEELLASTWNIELSAEMGRLVGNEAIWSNNPGWYAPAMNIHRTPFAGRNFEYYSEDPYISGVFARELVNAAAKKGVITYPKHFVLNDQETNRDGIATWSNEQAIREIYLLPFEIAFKHNEIDLEYTNTDTGETETKSIAAAYAVMTSYNRIGATWAGGNYHLMTEILRDEWGFNGLVLTDYNGSQEYMDTRQMLESGGESKLRTLDQGFSVNELRKNATLAHLARDAAHRYLYTQANSLVMNGLTHSQTVSNGFPVYKLMLIGVDIIAAVGIILLVRAIVKLFRKKEEIIIKMGEQCHNHDQPESGRG
jgi:beta-glucosidase